MNAVDVPVAHETCANCGHLGPHAQETGKPDECRACHTAPKALRDMLRRDHEEAGQPGVLDARTWPGNYPLFYVTKCGESLCAACALKALREGDDDPPVAFTIHYEGPPERCAGRNCKTEIKSAYGNPQTTAEGVRAKIDAVPIAERCDPRCKTWGVFDTASGPEIQRCDDCWHGRPDPLSDDEARLLPEAQAELAAELPADGE